MKADQGNEEWRSLLCKDVINQSHCTEMGMLLNPVKYIGGDVKDLASRLMESCSIDEVRSVEASFSCLTTYYITKWMASQGKEATVGVLLGHLAAMRRFDVVEILTNAAKAYELNLSNGDHATMDDNGPRTGHPAASLSVSSSEYIPPTKEISNTKSASWGKKFISKVGKARKSNKENNPKNRQTSNKVKQQQVFIAYTTDTKDHACRVEAFANTLRKFGFDARLDKTQVGEGFSNASKYLYSELTAARYIIVAVSPMFRNALKVADQCVEENTSIPDDKTKAIKLIMTYIQDDLLHGGCVYDRYLTVLMKGCKSKYIPKALSPASVYDWTCDEERLLYRLRQVEQFKLAPIRALPAIQSTVITDDLFQKGLKL